MATAITIEILEAFLNCKFKAQLRLNGQQGTKSDYEGGLSELRADVRLKAIQKIRFQQSGNTPTNGIVLNRATLSDGVPFLINADLFADRLSIHFDGLKKVDGDSDLGDFHYVPILFYEGHKIRKPQRLLLEVLSFLLARVQGKHPSIGIIYHGSENGTEAKTGRSRY